MKKLLFVLLLALAGGESGSVSALAGDAIRYPDFWGRELTAPPGRIVNGYYLRDKGTGDYVITYTHHAADPETGNLQTHAGWTRIDFFAGNPAPISAEEEDAIRVAYGMPRPRVQSRGGIWLYLPGEMQVKPWSRELKGAGCWVNYAGSLILRDKEEKVVAQKVVLRLLDAPEKREYWSLCQSSNVVARNMAESHYEARVDALSFVLYPLKDGTFLAEGSASPFLIRFRPDLTSPFVDSHPNLFLVDSDEVDRVVKASYSEAQGFSVQAANDALYEYALELKRRKLASQNKQ